MIRNERYKLAFFYGKPLDLTGTKNEPTDPTWEFYVLQKDPNENHGSYLEAEYSQVINGMKQELLKRKEMAQDHNELFPEMKSLISGNWD